MKQKVWIVVLGIMVVLFFGIIMSSLNQKGIAAIYQREEEIVRESDTYNLNKVDQKLEGNILSGSAELEGMDTIWKYETEVEEEVEITYLLKASQGKAKLVLIYPDKTIDTFVECTKDFEMNGLVTKKLWVKPGLNRIKLVAQEDTKLAFELEIEVGELFKLGF